MNLSTYYNVSLYNRKSLIIFDEVQKFPRAHEGIKYLVEDGRYDYIETGSLLTLKSLILNIILPSEVKSSSYRNHKSLDKYLEKRKDLKINKSYVIYAKDLYVEGNITYIPIYMTMFL